jgi:hypothetical protein
MFDDLIVRTTLDIDDDVLQAVKEIAAVKDSTAGKIVSELARQALLPKRSARIRNGVPLFSTVTGRVITMEAVNSARDE